MSPQSRWSAELRVLVHPHRTFRALAVEVPALHPVLLAMRRPFLLLVLGAAFVSFSSAGRLVLGHLFWATLSLAFVVVLHLLALGLTLGLVSRRVMSARDIDLYFVARAPWAVLLVALSIWLVLLADGSISIFGLFLGGVMPILLLLTTLSSSVLDFAFFRSGLALGRLRALVATLLVLVLYFGLGSLWYVVTEQLGPLLASGVD